MIILFLKDFGVNRTNQSKRYVIMTMITTVMMLTMVIIIGVPASKMLTMMRTVMILRGLPASV